MWERQTELLLSKCYSTARMNEAKSRSKRVKTLQEETLKIRETLGAAIFPLLDAVTELRKTLDDRFHFSPSSGNL